MHTNAQIDEDQVGAWYMYFWDARFTESQLGLQGDLQYRSWNAGKDLEQLLMRGGLTYRPKETTIKFTLGYAYVLSGVFGEENTTSEEHRIYQEALLPHQVGKRFFLGHRFRFEERFVENQDFRTRFRYAFFINVPINKDNLGPGSVYLALYDELFVNGQRGIGNGSSVEIFDRNRFYFGLGYGIKEGLRCQVGFMQQATDTWIKNQFQFSLHHFF